VWRMYASVWVARGDVREARGASDAGEEGGYCGRVSLFSYTYVEFG
jgi:hypothetical protein